VSSEGYRHYVCSSPSVAKTRHDIHAACIFLGGKRNLLSGTLFRPNVKRAAGFATIFVEIRPFWGVGEEAITNFWER